PDDRRLVGRAGHHALSVGRERDGHDGASVRVSVSPERADALARRSVPQNGGGVAGAGENSGSVRGKGDGLDLGRVARELPNPFARLDVPQDGGGVGVSGERASTIGRERDANEVVSV